MTDSPAEPVRIAKFLAAAGIASRRRCEDLVTAGEITVNGNVISAPGTKVDPATDTIVWQGEVVTEKRKHYVVLNKPVGYTCSAGDAHAKKLVTELFPEQHERLFTVGRLDRESEGLLICTNDGDFAQIISHPSHEIPKRYRVWVQGSVYPGQMRRLEHGIKDKGDVLKALNVRQIKRQEFRTELEFVIAEGKNREIRRMCRNCGWRVLRLQRVQIGPVKLGQLDKGMWRSMTLEERQRLLELAGKTL
ncbi:MAG: pseudouridine synthase [Lentisphaeria bacterium]|nr:pseudouridine synthase [Lentisphaeria bacterium]